MSTSATPEYVSYATADARLGGALTASLGGGYGLTLLFDGDLTLDGDFLTAVDELRAGQDFLEMIVVTGDLTVHGPVALRESMPGLYVGGRTRAETLEAGDAEVRVHDGTFTYLVHGYHNDGTLRTGTVDTPWVVEHEHLMDVHAPGARWVDTHGDAAHADFAGQGIADAFVPEVVDLEYNELRIPEFLDRLRAGLPVLRPGARTASEAALDHVARARANRSEHLHLSGRKLREFPADVLGMPWLRTLVLDGNPLGELPEGLGTLTRLERLSVRDCGLTALPDSIGDLAALRVLRVAGNEAAFTLPAAVGRLGALEELDISRLSDQAGPLVLPDTFGGLVGLRRLVADRTDVVFPRAAHGLPGLEEVSMAGGGSGSFPEAVTTFPNLRRLDLSGNPFETIPDSLLRLTRLEELDLGNSLGLVRDPLPDLGRLPALRVLGLGGRAVSVPAHTLLRQLFGMALTALEELRIDRWDELGPEDLVGIGTFRRLRTVDLSFNGLGDLPAEFDTLPELATVDLTDNRLPRDVRDRIAAAHPTARIDLRSQRGLSEDTRAAAAAIREANALRDSQRWNDAVAAYDAVITGGTGSDHDLHYAHYGRMWVHAQVGYGTAGSEEERTRHRLAGVPVAEECMRLLPPNWRVHHFTDEGQFHREVVRYATNYLAWELLHAPDRTRADLDRALELIEQGAVCVDGAEHTYVRDTHARVLLALGRDADAWRVVRQALGASPDFDPIQDLAEDPRYLAWSH
ncbi:hypothetical protein R8Z50_11975 [Longispora sp. K20-0274]|uniref:leucine-rich repeat domain-containing protein n=1 Tax=Longispora sp. K20-0274 TaxID=3088255 RepID=UPI00399B5A85